jgi:aryl-alcohol dehydrogenase-like predicted oxidoreductase
MLPGHATSSGTSSYANRFSAANSHGFYRSAQSLAVSTLGLGSYLGEMNAEADSNYEAAVVTALDSGINFIDTSLNYRNQRSERNIGVAIAESPDLAREHYVICTKAGYLVPGALPPPNKLSSAEIVGDMHSMAPAFLEDQLERSRTNLGLECIDVLYLHNPETQLSYLSEDEFYKRILRAFEKLEALANSGRIQYYGAATWNGFRQQTGGLSLQRMSDIASSIAGADRHRFRFIQLPFNLAMTEALSQRDADGLNVLDHAKALNITAIASASILQSRLTRGLPPVIIERLKGPSTDAQRAIQFTRSTPGVTTALVGMGRPEHVEENLGITRFPPATPEEFQGLFR